MTKISTVLVDGWQTVWFLTKTILLPWRRLELMPSARSAYALWAKSGISVEILGDGVYDEAKAKARYRYFCIQFALVDSRRGRISQTIFGVAGFIGLVTWVVILNKLASTEIDANFSIVLFLLLEIPTLGTIVAHATRTTRDWLVFLCGAITHAAIGAGATIIQGSKLSKFFVSPENVSQLGALESVSYIGAAMCLAASVISAITRVIVTLVDTRILNKNADLYLIVYSLRYTTYVLSGWDKTQRRRRYIGTVASAVEFLAELVDRYSRGGSPAWSAAGKISADRRLRSCRDALRKHAMSIMVANAETKDRTVEVMQLVAAAFLLELYGYLPSSDTDELASRRKIVQSVIHHTVAIIVAALPLSAYFLLPLAGITLPDAVRSWFVFFAVIWAIVRIVAILDPNYKTALTSAREIIADVHAGAEKFK